jgi:hypothetical protein
MFVLLSFFLLQLKKKKAADNCGPMCDCADSCFRLSIEQVDIVAFLIDVCRIYARFHY